MNKKEQLFREEIKEYIKENGNRLLPLRKFASLIMGKGADNCLKKREYYSFTYKYFNSDNPIVSISGTSKHGTIALDQAILFYFLTQSKTDTLDVESVALLFEGI